LTSIVRLSATPLTTPVIRDAKGALDNEVEPRATGVGNPRPKRRSDPQFSTLVSI